MSQSIEVLLANDDITVLGPPEIVELSIDIGPKGDRGSKIFVGTGNPNVVSIGQTPMLNDMYINTAPGSDYAYMYTYVVAPGGGNQWEPVLKVNPTIYSENHLTTFTVGTGATVGNGSVVIPIENIVEVSGAPLTAANFSVQYSIIHTNPVASAMVIPALVTDDLVINLEAIEFTSSGTEPLDGEYTVHILVTIVYPE